MLFDLLLREVFADDEQELVDSVLHVDDANLHSNQARFVEFFGHSTDPKSVSSRQKMEDVRQSVL